MPSPLILASSSPFRRMLMENAGLRFDAIAADIDERSIEAPLAGSGAGPDAVALVLAKAKARNVSERYPNSLVIGTTKIDIVATAGPWRAKPVRHRQPSTTQP